MHCTELQSCLTRDGSVTGFIQLVNILAMHACIAVIIIAWGDNGASLMIGCIVCARYGVSQRYLVNAACNNFYGAIEKMLRGNCHLIAQEKYITLSTGVNG